jgi:hypothetical protein
LKKGIIESRSRQGRTQAPFGLLRQVDSRLANASCLSKTSFRVLRKKPAVPFLPDRVCPFYDCPTDWQEPVMDSMPASHLHAWHWLIVCLSLFRITAKNSSLSQWRRDKAFSQSAYTFPKDVCISLPVPPKQGE